MLSKVTPIVLMTILSVAMMTEASINRKRRGVGWSKVDATDSEVQEAVATATAHLQGAMNSTKVYRLQEVELALVKDVQIGLVRGKIFDLILKIGQTDCFRRANVDVKNCPITKVHGCVVTVSVWQNTSEVTMFFCQNGVNGYKTTRMTGGETDIDVNNDDVIQAVTFATAELTSRSNGRYRVQHQRIIEATEQIGAGVMYRITMGVTVTAGDGGKSETAECSVKVSDQSWMTPRYKLEEYKCNRLIS